MLPEQNLDFLSKEVIQSRYLFVDLSPPQRIDFAVACAGYEECTHTFNLRREGFLYYALEYIISGKWELQVENKRHILEAGHVFAYRPDMTFSLRALPGEQRLSKLFVDFTGTEAGALLNATGLDTGCPRALAETRWVRDIFDQLLDCGYQPKHRLQQMSTLLVKLLLLRLDEKGNEHATNSRAYERYKHCRDYVAERFREIKSADELAYACNLDPAYLNRLFKKHGSESPYRLLTRLKLEYAAGCMIRHAYSVKQAALEVGFEDPYHFSRLFKNHFGQAPSHYTEQSLGKKT